MFYFFVHHYSSIFDDLVLPSILLKSFTPRDTFAKTTRGTKKQIAGSPCILKSKIKKEIGMWYANSSAIEKILSENPSKQDKP